MFPITLLLILIASCASHPPSSANKRGSARDDIASNLPDKWQVMAPTENQHAYDKYFAKTNADAFTLIGPGRNAINWVDRDGKQHQEMIAAECIFVWVVPANFQPSWPLIDLSPGAQWPERLGDAGGVAVYAMVDQVITDPARLRQIMDSATEISSPWVQVSWSGWRRDIPAALSK
jgi:hypothetical protein